MNVCIIDYNSGNLGSVSNVLDFLGVPSQIEKNPDNADQFSHYILPGVGSFKFGMDNLSQSGWSEYIVKNLPVKKTPFLGICLGMQLLATAGFEDGTTQGLNLIAGNVVRFEPVAQESIPHVGWNDVALSRPSDITENIQDLSDFYFVHSYYFKAKKSENICGTTDYCGKFPSIIQNENVWGVQFHPEKSSKNGIQIFKNFLKN